MPYIYDYPMPAVTVDVVVLRHNKEGKEVLLIKRKNEPFRNYWALPGGFIDIDEDLKDAALRELREETGIIADSAKQLFAVGTPGRDPRHRTISIVYYVKYDEETMQTTAGDDAIETRWFDVTNLPELAFDHNHIIIKALQKI